MWVFDDVKTYTVEEMMNIVARIRNRPEDLPVFAIWVEIENGNSVGIITKNKGVVKCI